ncbi:MAG TPA: DUF6114 domain-containing protein [Streptosporangiaceae bacterium]|nr:DUF6114 domain-containing protein [Streptosporangiaceae bacterium]
MNTSEDGAGSAGTNPAEPRHTAGTATAAARAASAWHAFRDWRRSRPFWGGLLLLLAGLELLGIPLLSVLAHGSVKVVVYIGIGGVFGVLIGGLLAACGLLIWFHPVQRVFYAIAGALLAVASFVATNLGGFFLGMLLGVIGASLSFGWAPEPGRSGGQHRPRPPRAAQPSEGLGLVLPGTAPRDTGTSAASSSSPARRAEERADPTLPEGEGAAEAGRQPGRAM